jgi:hypothetical protein
MCLNTFFALAPIISNNEGLAKLGRCQMTTIPENELQESRREPRKDTTSELVVMVVLIAIVWVILSL